MLDDDLLPGERLRDLQIFWLLAAGTEGRPRRSSRTLANELNQNRTTVYRAIQRVEEWLSSEEHQVELFTGPPRNRVLTDAGRQLAHQVSALLEDVRAVRRRLRSEPPLIRVGVSGSTAGELVLASTATMREQGSTSPFRLQLRSLAPAAVCHGIEERSIDFAVVRGAAKPVAPRTELLCPDRLCLLFRKGAELPVGVGDLSSKDDLRAVLERVPHIAYAGETEDIEQLRAALYLSRATPAVVVETRAMALAAVRAGLGICLLSLPEGQEGKLTDLLVIPVGEDTVPPASFWLVHGDGELSGVSALLAEELRSARRSR